MRSVISCCLMVLVSTLAVHSNGLIYQLPANATSSRHELEMRGTFNGREVTTNGSLTTSSVGETTVEGEACRWNEFRLMIMRDNVVRISLAKCLIPRKRLGRGKSPGERLIRGWIKTGDGEPPAFTDSKTIGAAFRVLPYLTGPPQNGGDPDAVEVDSSPGKLSCHGVTGRHEIELGNGTTRVSVENRRHEKSPFGAVSAVWLITRAMHGQVTGTSTNTMTLADVGTTVLTELPDKNRISVDSRRSDSTTV